MKTFFIGIVGMMSLFSLRAQTYNITSNTLWSSVHPGDCWTCTFNISAGITLTMNTSNTCGTCNINGGTVSLSSNFTFQSVTFTGTTINMNGFTLTPNSGFATFTNATVNATGASLLNAVVPVNITNSTFNFSGSSEFRNNGGTLSVSAGHLYFYGASFFNATAGPVNLNSASQMVAGDGSKTSTAYLLFNGPTLNLADAASSLSIANINNYYYNWGAYNSLSNSKTYTTTNNLKNCGGSGQNACQQQYFYGCASFGNLGATTCSVLASPLTDFKISASDSKITLSWSYTGEPDNSYFIVEHSTDGIHFSSLATIYTSSLQTVYTYTADHADIGENDYRIRMINADGRISFSNTIPVVYNPSSDISIYPNPSTGGHFFVQIPSVENSAVRVYGMQGQLLYSGTFSGQLKYSVNLPPIQKNQQLVVQIVTNEKSATFHLLNLQ